MPEVDPGMVSVVIPTYKRPQLVRKAVLAACKQDLPPSEYEVLVVDTSPDDATQREVEAIAASAPCRVRCLRKPPEGPGPSRNLGAAHARGEFIAFLDDDCEPTPGWLRAGRAAFEDGVGLVQGRTEPDPHGRPGVFTHYITVTEESCFYETCNMFYRRTTFEAAGGFRGKDLTPTAVAPMGGEDIDLAWRVKRAGWQSRFADGALVYHAIVPISIGRWLCRKTIYIFPSVIRGAPELRRYMWGRYFYNRTHAAFTLALTGLAFIPATPFAAALALPYLWIRAAEPSATLKGPMRVVRIGVYAARDLCAFTLLAAASIRYRTLLL